MVVITSFILKFLARELRQLFDFGLFGYLTQLWNVFDIASLVANEAYVGYVLYAMLQHEEGIKQTQQRDIRLLGAFNMFFMWLKMFYWMKLYAGPAYFLIQLQETAIAVVGFLTMYAVVCLAFANFFHIIQMNVPEGGMGPDGLNYVEPNFGIPFVDAFVVMCLLSIGEFTSMDGYSEGHNPLAAWTMFALAIVIMLLLFMNMLIAVMAAPFAAVEENKSLYIYQSQIEMILDFQGLVDLKKVFRA
jgi:hypothetical protein